MALTENFSVSQSLSEPSEITLTDTSTGSDGTVTSRRVYVIMANGEYLVEDGTTTDYEVWDYADEAITLDVLSRSVAPQIRVDWLNVSNSVLYTKTTPFALTANDDLFAYDLVQKLAAAPDIVNDNFFYSNFLKFMANQDAAENAILLASDTAAAQALLDRNYALILNESKFF